MSGFTAHPTQPGNTQELTSAGTLNYDIIRSGSTRRWGTEPQMKSSGSGTNSTEQRKNSKSPCPGTPGLLRPTTAENLQNHCRPEHRAKTHAGHHTSRKGNTTTWTTPTGHTYTTNDQPFPVEQWPTEEKEPP